jgi:TonB family protein
MALREKFGKLVLLEETDSGPLGNEYRAARLGPAGFDRLVTVLRFSPAVSGHAEASKRLVEEARLAAQIHNPGVVRMLGVGRVGASFYVSSELVEGRTLRAILARCRDEGFPFAADHALMIASRAAAVLELLHGRKDDAGRPLLHGLLSPRQLVVAFDGEVKMKGLGLWSALGSTELLAPEERAYLAPEQATTKGDPRSDVYALGLVLLEALSGRALEGADPLESVASVRVASAGGEPSPLPRPLADLLGRSLGRDPATRFQGMGELRKAIDALLFSGEFAPTTFDLAFFMHTLFRDEVERDARAVEDARAGDYREFLTDEAAKPAPTPPVRTEPFDARAPAPDVTGPLAALPTEVSAPTVPAPTVPEPARTSDAAPSTVAKATSVPGPDSSQARLAARASREAGAREAAARLSLGGAPAARPPFNRSLGLALGLIGAVVVGGGAGWLYFVGQRRGAATAPAQGAEQAAADVRVRELEARIAQLEREKAEAETRAADEARRTVEQQAAAGGQAVDPAAIEQAQMEARRRARLEQERKQQQELLRLAEEKRAEEQRMAAAMAAAAATPAPTPLPVPTPTPAPTPTASSVAEVAPAPPQATATSPGPLTEPAVPTPLPATPVPAPAAATTLAASPSPARMEPADASDPAVRPPGLVSEEAVPYPVRAIPRRISAVVVVRALVDERGRVVEAVITQASGQPPEYGFDAAALKRVRSRKYRPARREDVPVPIWVVVRVEFRPPPIR